MRKQITAYLRSDTKKWLKRYARSHGIDRSEVLRLLLRRERRIRWLSWALANSNNDARSLRRNRRDPSRRVRPQAVAYIDAGDKAWLTSYANRLGFRLTDVVRVLIEREQEVKWLEWALNTDDPTRGPAKRMQRRRNPLPPRWSLAP